MAHISLPINESLVDTEIMLSGSNYNHSNILAYLIYEVYRPRIEEDVSFNCLMPFMPFMKNIMGDIYTMEKAGNKKDAANVFFNYLKEVDEKGKYQMFVEALRRAKYLILVKALENEEPIVNNEHEHKQLITMFFREIIDTIDPEVLSNQLQMKEVITPEEGNQIRKTASRTSARDANYELLLAIPHRSPGWYEIFLGLLLESRHINLVKKIDPKFFEKEIGSLEGAPNSITENVNVSVSVDSLPFGQNNSTNLTTSNVGESKNDSDFKMSAIDTNSNYSTVVESKKGLDFKIAASNATVAINPLPQSHQRGRTQVSSSESKTEILSEFADLKSLVLEQTKYLKDLLQQTEHVIRRVDYLEQKLDDVIKFTSTAHKK